MGSRALVYKEKLKKHLKEASIHLQRLERAIKELEKYDIFLLDNCSIEIISNNPETLAYSDQIIYRFSKFQDTIGAKLFKSYLLAQGQSIDKPFIDILNQLEKDGILLVDDWFELRDLRNEIAHEYEDNIDNIQNILNTIYRKKELLKQILTNIKKASNVK